MLKLSYKQMRKHIIPTHWKNVVDISSSKKIPTGIEINDKKCRMKKVKFLQSAKAVNSTVSQMIGLVLLLAKMRRQL